MMTKEDHGDKDNSKKNTGTKKKEYSDKEDNKRRIRGQRQRWTKMVKEDNDNDIIVIVKNIKYKIFPIYIL